MKIHIHGTPQPGTGIIVVIPAYKEKHLTLSLNSLAQCTQPIGCATEVIVVINEPENASEEVSVINQAAFEEASQWSQRHSTGSIRFYIHFVKLPNKDAGVGLARRVGMDLAAERLASINKSKDGIIVCFDADSLCAKNYLEAIQQHFSQHPKSPAASIYFEHPLSPTESILVYEPAVYEGIIKYELFLRYYVGALRYAGHPFAFQTIGSSMAVRANVYTAQGGMNKRKAGEDFYFLQKIIPLGHFSEINSTRVIPSPRSSDRVPFGTGRAISEWLGSGQYTTYNFSTFEDIKIFNASAASLFKSNEVGFHWQSYPDSIRQFIDKEEFIKKIEEINSNASTISTFENRFFRWFDAFMALKFVHFCRDHFYADLPVAAACSTYIEKKYRLKLSDEKEMLAFLRQQDRLYLG